MPSFPGWPGSLHYPMPSQWQCDSPPQWHEWRYLPPLFIELLLHPWPSWTHTLQISDLLALATFWRGSCSGMVLIDGAWVSNDITVDAISWCSLEASPGNHWTIVLDINLLDCIWEPWYMVVYPPGHCLNCSIPLAHSNHLWSLQDYAETHKLPQKLDALFHLATTPSTSAESLQAALKSFDCIKTKDMKFAENRCCCFHAGLVQLSPILIYGGNNVFCGNLSSAGRLVGELRSATSTI